MIEEPRLPVWRASETAEFVCRKGDVLTLPFDGYMKVKNVIAGVLRFRIGKEERLLVPGDSCVVNPYEEAAMEALEDSLFFSVTVDQNKRFDALTMPAMTRFSHFMPGDAFLTDLCRRINREYRIRGPFFENMLNACVDAMLIHLYRGYQAKTNAGGAVSDTGKSRIARLAVDCIYKNVAHGITTSEIAHQIGVSGAYLCRCFKEATGMTVLEFAERIRLRMAKEDLSLGNVTVTAVAEKYKFGSLSYFSIRYKKYCGETPMQTLSLAKRMRSQ